MRKIFIVLVGISLCACTSLDVSSVNLQHTPIKKICIEENSKSIVDDLPGAIVRSIQKQGIETLVFSGQVPTGCQYHMKYEAFQGLDGAPFLAKFHVQLFKERLVLANGTYDVGSGLSLAKWGTTASKIEPVLEKMFVK